MNGELRQFISSAEQLGFAYVGTDGRGHPRFHCAATGADYSVPSTPSDWRSLRNSLSDLERLSGRKLPRPNSPHYRHQRVNRLDTRRSDIEVEQTGKAQALVAEAEALRARWAELKGLESTYVTIAEARSVFRRFEHLREVLLNMHHHIPPIESVTT